MKVRSPNLAEYQERFLYCKQRFSVVLAGTKTGKTHSHIFWLYEQSHGYEKKKKVRKIKEGMNFWWVAPVYAQAEIAFYRLWGRLSKTGLYKKNQSKLTITTPDGAVISFKSAEKPDNLYGEDVYAVVFDEFTRAREAAWHAIRSTITATKAKCKFIGNFKGNSNWGYQLSLKAETDPDNYFFSRVTAYDAVEAGILDAQEIEQAKKDLPKFMFDALYLALGGIDKARLITDDSIKNLLTNDFVSHGNRYLTADLAFEGSDLFVIFIWSGFRIIGFKVIEKNDGKEIEDTIKDMARKWRVPRTNICYDADGVGMFLKGYLKDAVSFKHKATPFTEEDCKVEYEHLKAQCQFLLAKMINANEIYFDCDISEFWSLIVEELEVVKNRDLDREGKLETLRKKEVRLLIRRSPDFTDVMAMRMYFVLNEDVDMYPD